MLRLQKEHFLPLAVIREKLADYDRGKHPARAASAAAVRWPRPLPLRTRTRPLPLEEAPNALGVPVSFVHELAEFGLVDVPERRPGARDRPRGRADRPRRWDLRRFGVEPRHLRMYETFAEREAALFSQILMPAFRHRTPETRQKLTETLTELTALTDDLKSRLLRRSLLRRPSRTSRRE